jgi:opacity protein-like surface antigen
MKKKLSILFKISVFKISLIALIFTLNYTISNAQISLGGGLAFGTGIDRAGLDLRATFDIGKNWRIAPAINYYFPNDNDRRHNHWDDGRLRVWEINADANYMIDVNNDLLGLYAMFGLNITSWRWDWDNDNNFNDDDDYSNTELGVNLGMGLDFNLDKVVPFVEVKYVLGGFDQGVVALGVKFKLK